MENMKEDDERNKKKFMHKGWNSNIVDYVCNVENEGYNCNDFMQDTHPAEPNHVEHDPNELPHHSGTVPTDRLPT